MGTGSRCFVSDTLIRLQINRPKPHNICTMSPLVINRLVVRLTLLSKLILADEMKKQVRT